MEKKENKYIRFFKSKLKLTLLLSVIFHAVVLTLNVENISWSTPKKPKKDEQRIKIMLNPNNKANQIVTIETTGRKEKPQEAKFLGKQDNTVDREVVSKKIGTFKAAGKGIRTGTKTPRVTKDMFLAKKSVKKKKTKGKSLKKKLKGKKRISLSDLMVGEEEKEPQKEATPTLASLGLENGRAPTAGLSQNNDFVEDVPLGDMTALNTVEYKYYGFYHRIKQKLEQYWGDTLRKKAEALYKSGRRIPASTNKITSLLITIDNFGNIVDIKVKGTSGVRELDDAAIESFNRAGPFPNPPSGMMKDGIAQIEWGFVVKS
ncbi:MAG: energy transducer TonB [Oligoflexia bacterium]|nr:energy transducer TonB [Oligoflexia bacterium]